MANRNILKYENYQLTELENGLKIVSEHIPHFRSISLGFWIPAGSRNEYPGNNGITHLIEHLLFKGTKQRTYKDIAIAFDSIGAEFNAFTDKENSCVYADFLDNHLDNCLEILFDVATCPSFLPENIKLEKRVIFEEIKMVKDNPSDDIFNYFYEVVFNGHPLSLPILGSRKTLGFVNSNIIRQYFEKNFNPDGMVISAAGNVKHPVLVEEVKRNMEKLCTGRPQYRKEENSIIPEPSYVKKTRSYKGKTEASHLCLGGPGCDRKSPDKHALSLFTNILGGSISSRLFQKIREEKGLSYTIFAGNTQYTDAGIAFIYAATSTANTAKVTDLILKELKLIKSCGFSADELTIAKENTKGTIVLGVEDISSRMFRLGKALLIDKKIISLDGILKKIDNIKLNEVNDIVEKYFNPENLSMIVISKNGNGSIR